MDKGIPAAVPWLGCSMDLADTYENAGEEKKSQNK
jgi:hypothetical protein